MAGIYCGGRRIHSPDQSSFSSDIPNTGSLPGPLLHVILQAYGEWSDPLGQEGVEQTEHRSHVRKVFTFYSK